MKSNVYMVTLLNRAMALIRMIWLCFFGPRVRRNFFEGPGLDVGHCPPCIWSSCIFIMCRESRTLLMLWRNILIE